ncbi:DEAD/DEAH box helicase [Geomonas silvestris]|uniref:DEAD/DEAH box helicase n=1 Tax=Geomonas silvestris TaxID=2740184 RepID=A0A6V8MDD7_9BACT|nr:DEAD/DEAH box helicase [Geomonas silvestris]GFO58015.1 DEAD/DEAH box helicase [Geomonas silvestris]
MESRIQDSFHPLIRGWFAETLGEPTEVQLRTWHEVVQRRHVLVTAPTGSGKTLAAFLWSINQLVSGSWPRGATRVIYVSPLKALNNDVRRNLLLPLEELRARFALHEIPFPSLQVVTRSGDTPAGERRRMLRSPPEILITTPESLNIMLASRGSRQLLTGVETVILDEIHAVAGTKRGTHLITAVERLTLLSGEFQRIALSATVRPLETVAEFVGGFEERGGSYRRRPVALVRGERTKRFELTVSAPEGPSEGDRELWPRLAARFAEIIAGQRSTLLFANSRRTTERVTRLINENAGAELAYAHHGSLSREIRLAVEERLKRGELKAIVATNSLELGIDIGELDTVVLIQTPRSISSAIQRIGRSGHGVGEVSRGLLFPTVGLDFVSAAVMARAIADGEIEELHPVEAPLDLLAQIVLSMALTEPWDLDELYAFLKTSYPYRNLSRSQFDLVIGMLEGRYADSHIPELRPRASVDRLDNTIATRASLSLLIFLQGGTIPERGYFDLRLKESGAKIGELDEEFVWERRLGESFALGAQVWQITEIGHSAVQVVPAARSHQIIPFWRAEELDRDFYYSEKLALFLEHCASLAPEELERELSGSYFMEPEAAHALVEFLLRQREATRAELPHRHHLLVEEYHDPNTHAGERQVILHTLWGNALNRPFTLALQAAWEKSFSHPLQAFYSNDSIALLVPAETDPRLLLDLVAPDQLETLLRASLEGSNYFGARFRENAGRALLLPKANVKRRMPLWLTRQRSKKLLAAVQRYGDFPVILETWRSALQDDFDLEHLKQLLRELKDGEIRITRCATNAPSPLARGLVWNQINSYVYQDDSTPPRDSGLGGDLFKELAGQAQLRPRLSAPLIREFLTKQQRTAPGYTPETSQELVDWVKERQLIPEPEWRELLEALQREHGLEEASLQAELAGRLVRLVLHKAALPLIAPVERLPELARSLRRHRDQLELLPLAEGPAARNALERSLAKLGGWPDEHRGERAQEREELAATRLVAAFLSYYGPVPVGWLEETLALPELELSQALHELEESGLVLVDRFGEESSALEVCDVANLEALLRMLRRSRRPAFQALEPGALPLFLAQFQGVARPGKSLEELRERLDQLLGLPLAASLWEQEVLPARLEPYFGSWLDSLMQNSDLMWLGCGEQRLSFVFPEELVLYRQEPDGNMEDRETLQRLFPDPNGRYSLSSICLASGISSAQATAELWKSAWQGEVTNDGFASVRKGILTKFSAPPSRERSGLRPTLARRWHKEQEGTGNWFLVPQEKPPLDPLEREELNKERVRVLLNRYGLLFKELLQRESAPLQWRALFRTLRIMELSGEVLAGHFFEGIPGLQFISHDAFRMLNEGLAQDAVYWFNAADPASLCGSGLEALPDRLPSRLPSTHLVYQGTQLVLVSRRYGKELEFLVGPDHPRLAEYLVLFRALLTREFNPVKRVVVDTVNGVPAATSPYAGVLKAFGFQAAYQGLELWRQY